MLASPTSRRPTRWCSASAAPGHRLRISLAIRSNAFSASGSYASYSRYRTLRPALWLRTRPRNVTTAPSAPGAAPDSAPTTASRFSSPRPIARSAGVTISVYGLLLAGRAFPPWPGRSRAGTQRSAESLALRELTLALPAPIPAVIQHRAPVADCETVTDRAGDIFLSVARGVGEREPQREAGGDGRRKRAAGAVSGPRLDARSTEFMDRPLLDEEVA